MASSRYCATCLTTFRDDPDACPNLGCGKQRPRKGWGNLLGPGDTLDRHYLITKPLAVGGAGLTYLAREVDGSGRPVEPDLAIKVLYTERDSGPFLRRLSNEAQILQELAHENIVQCRGFVHRTGQAPYLVTLFERGGSLTQHVKRVGPLPAVVAGGVLRQILLALDVAHDQGVVHRDLKPENVLLAEKVHADTVPRIRVADFGIAKVAGGVGGGLTSVGSFVGTPEYAAPEQFEGRAPTPATDVFAAGGLLYYLLSGEPPLKFTHRHDIGTCFVELLQQIPAQVPGLDDDPDRKAILQDLLNNMMCADDTQRWTIRQVIARLDDLFSGVVTATSEGSGAFVEDFEDDELIGGGHTFVWSPKDGEEDVPVNAPAPQMPRNRDDDGEGDDTLQLSDHGVKAEPAAEYDAFGLDSPETYPTAIPSSDDMTLLEPPPDLPGKAAEPLMPPLPGKAAEPLMPPLPGKAAEPLMPPLPGKPPESLMPPLPGKAPEPLMPPPPEPAAALLPPPPEPVAALVAPSPAPREEPPDEMDAFLAPRKKKPNELSLDDLFGGGDVDDDEEMVPEMFSSPQAKPKRATSQSSSSSFFFEESAPAPAPPPAERPPPPPQSAPVAAAPAAAPAPAPAPAPPANAGLWFTDDPQPIPQPLPADPRALLKLLGSAHEVHRSVVMAGLEGVDLGQLGDTMRNHRSGDDPLVGRGIGLAVAALKKPEWANQVRALLGDRDAGVRACAAQGLGEVGSGGLLAQLSRLLGDSEPAVRASAARALGSACAREGQQSLGKNWLSRLASDSAPSVVSAYQAAMQQLG